MPIPFYSSIREYNARKNEFDSSVQKVMSQGDFILGSEVGEFEKEAAVYLGTNYAVGVASGSDALIIASDILAYKDGAEVITPTFTFFASTSCIARIGGKPVFVDLDERSLNMDVSQIENKITAKTKGIIPVHLFLQTVPMQEICTLAQKYNLSVLEDAAEAWGMESKINNTWKKAGTIGDIGIYSFFPTKTLGAYGDAGLMVTNNEDLYKKIKSYRVHGSSIKYHHDYIGYNSRLDTIQAAILRVKLKTTSESIEKRKKHADHYTSLLSDLPGIRFPVVHDAARPVYYVYNILVQKRDELAAEFKKKEIGYSIYYPIPLHLQKCFAYLGHKKGDFPIAEKVCKEIIALPMYPELMDDEVDYICDVIRKFYK
jgi:dTDP-4-amino-4,6-dideoxygalactose transaminase